ncbi:MAG: hypothetical protein H0U98_16215 [Alphaproteobacteria bacterium]|nr:hypothetical protein [Alphaproteobacteria bacterium]
MPIDPVILLIEQIHRAEADLQAECRRNAQQYCRERAEMINWTLQRIRTLYADLVETVPTSSLGAAELIRIASHRLPFSQARYAYHLECIAQRLGAGQRNQNDLIWLRAMACALEAGQADDRNVRTAAIIALAIKGAAQPIVIHRMFAPRPRSRPDLDQLSQGPKAFARPSAPSVQESQEWR